MIVGMMLRWIQNFRCNTQFVSYTSNLSSPFKKGKKVSTTLFNSPSEEQNYSFSLDCKSTESYVSFIFAFPSLSAMSVTSTCLIHLYEYVLVFRMNTRANNACAHACTQAVPEFSHRDCEPFKGQPSRSNNYKYIINSIAKFSQRLGSHRKVFYLL